MVPGAGYLVDAIEVGCWLSVSVEEQRSASRDRPTNYFSTALTVSTASLWGDVAGSQMNGGPDGKVDMLDVSAVVDRFRQAAGAVDLHRADLSPAIPDRMVDFTDISEAVNAFRGKPYPFSTAAPACTHRPR